MRSDILKLTSPNAEKRNATNEILFLMRSVVFDGVPFNNFPSIDGRGGDCFWEYMGNMEESFEIYHISFTCVKS